MVTCFLLCSSTDSSRSDNDMYAHLNNSIYAFLFDSIVNTFLVENCGVNPFTARASPSPSSQVTASSSSPSSSPRASQIGLVVSSYCDYFSSVSFPSVLDLGLRVVKLGSSSVTYEIGVFDREEEVKVVGGYTHVFVDRDGMRPRKEGMDRGIREGLERLVARGREQKL